MSPNRVATNHVASFDPNRVATNHVASFDPNRVARSGPVTFPKKIIQFSETKLFWPAGPDGNYPVIFFILRDNAIPLSRARKNMNNGFFPAGVSSTVSRVLNAGGILLQIKACSRMRAATPRGLARFNLFSRKN